MRIIISTSSKSVSLYYMKDRNSKASKVSVSRNILNNAAYIIICAASFTAGYTYLGPIAAAAGVF